MHSVGYYYIQQYQQYASIIIQRITKDDWIQMNKYLQNKRYQSNCQSSFIKFCRNLNGNDIQLEAQYIQTKFISIIFNDLSFAKQEEQLLDNNVNELLFITIKQGLIYLSLCFLVLLISSIFITRILKPVSEMINIVEFQIRTSSSDQGEQSARQLELKTIIFIELSQSFTYFIQRHINYKQKKIETLSQLNYLLHDNAILNTKGLENLIDRPLDINIKQIYFHINQKMEIVNKLILQKITEIIQQY